MGSMDEDEGRSDPPKLTSRKLSVTTKNEYIIVDGS